MNTKNHVTPPGLSSLGRGWSSFGSLPSRLARTLTLFGIACSLVRPVFDARADEAQSTQVLTPAEAAARAGEVCSVTFKVKTAVRVTDITDKANHRPSEVLLVDVPNNDTATTPVERANIIVQFPVSSLAAFQVKNMDELARKFDAKTLVVKGKVETEPHPFKRDNKGKNQPRPRITVTDPKQIQATPQ